MYNTGFMRIIAGDKRGMKLLSPTTDISRPITDRVKESLFNVLQKYDLPAGKVVADLFSGVGSLGLESLSRGGRFVTFVEKDRKIADILKKNIEKAGWSSCSKVIRADAFKIGAPVTENKCDLVFVDPPYAQTMQTGENSPLAKLMNILAGQVTSGGFVIVRTHEDVHLLDKYSRFSVIERRQWGTMTIAILR